MHLYKFSMILVAVLTWSCSTPEKPQVPDSSDQKTTSLYLRWVGDSQFDDDLDDSTFQLCHSEYQVKQYFNMGNGMLYEGEKKALNEFFFTQYEAVPIDQNGWIRIRFIVNCQGETGRYRLLEADENYNPMTFDSRITQQLMTLTRNVNGWMLQYDEGRAEDYYQYLIFKIRDGQLIDIMP